MLTISKQIPTSASSDEIWIAWYKSMKKDFGKKKAKEAFSYIWASRQSKSANTNTLRDYFETQGINIKPEGLISGIIEIGDDVFDKVGSYMRMGRTAVMITGGVLLFAVGALVLQIALQPFKTLKEVGKVSGKNVETGSKMLK
jgi:hypothetical protein